MINCENDWTDEDRIRFNEKAKWTKLVLENIPECEGKLLQLFTERHSARRTA